MANFAGWALGLGWFWGLRPGGRSVAPVVHVVGTVVAPINLRPGYVIQTTKAFFSVNETPFRPSSDVVTLNDEGFYTVDIADSDVGANSIRYLICIVEQSVLRIGVASLDVTAPPDFRRLAATLTGAYPNGRVVGFSTGRTAAMEIDTNRAASFEIRRKNDDGSYSKIGEALALSSGSWRSEGFALPRGASDLKVVVTFASQSIVLS